MVVELKDLVVLSFAENNCYTKVERANAVCDERLRIDVSRGVWTYSPWKDVRIGHSRFIDRCSREGVIGVYDASDVKQLGSMVHDAMETVDRHSFEVD